MIATRFMSSWLAGENSSADHRVSVFPLATCCMQAEDSSIDSRITRETPPYGWSSVLETRVLPRPYPGRSFSIARYPHRSRRCMSLAGHRSNRSSKGEGVCANGLTTVTPLQEKPSCKSSDSSTLQRLSVATARIRASQICRWCVALISNAI